MRAICLLVAPVFFLAPLAPAQSEEAELPQFCGHAEIADGLTRLLERTADCLATCVDEASTEAALPELRQLNQEAQDWMQRQDALPEPTVQDFLAAQSRANDFLAATKAISGHISRLQKNGLLSPQIREILKIAPENSHTTP